LDRYIALGLEVLINDVGLAALEIPEHHIVLIILGYR
jgi:hypothetical protein